MRARLTWSRLVAAVGPDTATRLAHEFAGARLPRAPERRLRRNEEITRKLDAGLAPDIVARRYGMSLRHLRRIEKAQ